MSEQPEMMAWACWLPRKARPSEQHRAVGYAFWCGPMGHTTDADEVESWGALELAEWLRAAS